MEQRTVPPGYRFSPTDEELVMYYLKNKACCKDFHPEVIVEAEIYKHEPWDLLENSPRPGPDPVWYFFNAQEKRHSHSSRINRTTSKGYWKATGKDRRICSGPHTVGIKKTLIYYGGRAPSGQRTDWVMHEYKLDDEYEKKIKAIFSPALCRIRKKGGPGPRNGEQFGAPVYDQTIEWVEDVNDAADEKFSSQSPQCSDFTTASCQADSKEPKEEDSFSLYAKGLELDDLSPVECVKYETDVDAFVQSLFDPDFSSLEPGMLSFTDGTQRGHINFNGHGQFTSSDIENKGTIVHNHLQPFASEEDILKEMLHLSETGVADLSAQVSHCINDDTYAHSRDVPGGFIEIDDMNFPFDHYILSSPQDYGINQQQLPNELIDKEAMFGCPTGLLTNQGSAARRVRLQVIPPSLASETDSVSSGPTEKILSKVSRSSGKTVQVDNSTNGSQPGESSIVSDSDATLVNGTSLPRRPVASDLVHFSPSVVSKAGCLIEADLDCELGYEGEGSSHSSTDITFRGSHTPVKGFDDEADPCSRAVPGKSAKPVNTSSNGNKDVGELMNKLKAITFGSHLVELESNFGSTFNDKVFALGKPATSLLPVNNRANPYRSLKKGLMGNVCRLGLACLVIFFIFLGIHVLTKLVLSLVA